MTAISDEGCTCAWTRAHPTVSPILTRSGSIPISSSSSGN